MTPEECEQAEYDELDKNGVLKFAELPPGTAVFSNEIPCGIPRRNCRKCHGRGRIGHFADGKVLQCTCIHRSSNATPHAEATKETIA